MPHRSFAEAFTLFVFGSCIATIAATPRAHAQPLDAQAGTPPAMYPYARGGTRVKAEYFHSSGTEMFRRLRDDVLTTPCSWTRSARAGELRCLPSRNVDVLHLDAACSEPVASVAPSAVSAHGERASAAPLLPDDLVSAATDATTDCDDTPARRDAYRVGERVAAPATLYRQSAAGCIAVSRAEVAPLHRLAMIPDASIFAAGRLARIDVGEGLFLSRVIGDDGSEQTLAVIDAESLACRPTDEGTCVARSCPGLDWDVPRVWAGVRVQRSGVGPLFRKQRLAATELAVIPLDRGDAFADARGIACMVVLTNDSTGYCLPDDFRPPKELSRVVLPDVTVVDQ